MKKTIRYAALLVVFLLVLVPIRSSAEDGRSVRWLQGSWSDRQLLVTACQRMDPALLENTQQPEIYRQMYDIVTGMFPVLLTDPQAYSEMERFSAAWQYLTNTATYTYDLSGYADTPHFARLLLHNRGACQHFADTLAFLLDCFEIENDEIMGSLSNGQLHLWNLVCIDGQWYHSDASSTQPVFLYNDTDLQDRGYRWNTAATNFTAPSLTIYDVSIELEIDGNFAFYPGTGVLVDWNRECGDTVVVIPDRTRQIAPSTFAYADTITRVVLPDNLTSIGYGAFGGCTALGEIELPSSLQHIGKNAFSQTAIREITIPAGVQMADEAFALSSLERATFAEGCTRVFASMFKEASLLEEVTLPTSIEMIEVQAFADCTSLRELDLSDLNCEIGIYAFSGTGLTSIRFPSSMRVLQSGVLGHCPNLTEVILPEDLLVLQYNFANCPNLTDLRIPGGVQAIDSMCFREASGFLPPPNLNILCAEGSVAHFDALSKGLNYTLDPSMTAADAPVIRPYSVTAGGLNLAIDYDSHSVRVFGYDIESLELEEGTLVIPDLYAVAEGDFTSYYPVTEISADALFAAPMTQIRLPVGLTTLGDRALRYCQNLTSLDLSGCPFLRTVPYGLCEGNAALAHVELGDSVTTIAENAFFQTGLTSFRAGGSLETIKANAFAETNLNDVYLGPSVKTIGDYAFNNLTTEHCAFWFEGDAPYLGEYALGNMPRQSVVLHRPGAGGFHTPDYIFHEVGTYDDNSPVVILDRFNVYAPSSKGTQMVLVHGFRTEWGSENLAYAAFYDADNRMVACARRYLTTANAHTINGIQFNDVLIPDSAVRMSVFLMAYGSFTPVALAADFDLIGT